MPVPPPAQLTAPVGARRVESGQVGGVEAPAFGCQDDPAVADLGKVRQRARGRSELEHGQRGGERARQVRQEPCQRRHLPVERQRVKDLRIDDAAGGGLDQKQAPPGRGQRQISRHQPARPVRRWLAEGQYLGQELGQPCDVLAADELGRAGQLYRSGAFVQHRNRSVGAGHCRVTSRGLEPRGQGSGRTGGSHCQLVVPGVQRLNAPGVDLRRDLSMGLEETRVEQITGGDVLNQRIGQLNRTAARKRLPCQGKQPPIPIAHRRRGRRQHRARIARRIAKPRCVVEHVKQRNDAADAVAFDEPAMIVRPCRRSQWFSAQPRQDTSRHSQI